MALAGRALVIRGPSGSGKSALALDLMAFGCDLVADDRTELTRRAGALHARCPAAIRGLIEARGLGLLHASTVPEALVTAILDLGEAETDRLPPRRTVTVLGVPIPLFHTPIVANVATAALQLLKGGRHA